jgi:hypothetical protein
MKKTSYIFFILLLLMALALPAGSVVADSPSSSATWYTQYYNNAHLEGDPVKTAYEAEIDYDWGYGAPIDGLAADHFSVRWTANVSFEAGYYTFTASVDDGVRVWVDGELIIDEWQEQALTTFTAQEYLSKGTHKIQVAYFEATELAALQLWWRLDRLSDEPVEGESIWSAQYYDNAKLEGDPVKTAQEKKIDHDWGYQVPMDGLPADHFSARWTTSATFEEGLYGFTATVDDGVRVWVDGDLLIDEWREQGVTSFTAQKHLSQGPHRIQVAYFEGTGAAVAKFWWRLDKLGKDDSVAEEIIIDNEAKGFTWGGPAAYRHEACGGYDGCFYWTKNTVYHPENYGKWTPHFEKGGRYEVFAYIPCTRATTGNLRYRIMHNGQRHDAIINQAWYSNEWVSLGTYTFNGDNKGKEFILAYDNTHEPYASKFIAFDAVKLKPR